MKIFVLDLGLNNLNSVRKTMQESATEIDHVEILSEYQTIATPALLILPGLGKFEAAMSSIQSRGFDRMIDENLRMGGSLVGICLGMHLLATESEESPGIRGLNLIPGVVRKLVPHQLEHVPNIGWNSTQIEEHSRGKFTSLESELDFYFVHSFVLEPQDPSHVLARTAYGCERFVSAVSKSRILGFQFHPEKSSSTGAALVCEIINWARA